MRRISPSPTNLTRRIAAETPHAGDTVINRRSRDELFRVRWSRAVAESFGRGGRVNDNPTGDDADRTSVPRGGQLILAVGIGLAVGAIMLGAYAYIARVPAGQTSSYLAPAGQLLLFSLLAVSLVAVAAMVVATRAANGRPAVGHAALLTAGAAACTAYAFLGLAPNRSALLISGPGARPVVVIAQTSWVVLTCAALLVLAGATSAGHGVTADRPRRNALAGLGIAGIAVATVAGIVVTSFSGVGVSSATTVQRIPIPALPTSVGTDVAYRLNVGSTVILPAGPGFVTTDDDAVVGYDGTTGVPRWRFPLADLPARCNYQSTRSTGVSDDAVVVVQCSRPPNDTDTDRFYERDSADNSSFLVGMDAVTGERLWLNDADWRLQGRANVDGQVLAAVSLSQVAALNPRTGKPLWTRDRPDDDGCRSLYDTVGTRVVYLDTCDASLHVFDTDSEALIDLAKQPGFPSGRPRLTFLAVDGDVVLLEARDSPNCAILAIDTKTQNVQPVPLDRPDAAVPGVDTGLIPGPVVEISRDSDARTVTLYVVRERRVAQLTDIDMYYEPTAYRWARVGDQFVTIDAYEGDYDRRMATVSVDGGGVINYPNPCGRPGGVIPVPGAVLALCPNYSSQGTITGYDVLGLR